jgi:hypothetical protein
MNQYSRKHKSQYSQRVKNSNASANNQNYIVYLLINIAIFNRIALVSVPRILNQQFLRRFLIQITRSHQKRINSVRGTHKGECCYIFGDGVSLRYFDLKNFQNFPAIITARIPLHLEVGYLDARY